MRSYMAGNRTTATAATANVAGAALWNPSTVKSLFVTAISWSKLAAVVDNLGLVRISARGTPALTVTAVAQNDVDADATPPSGALLDAGAYSVQPTLVSATAYMFRWNLPATIGAGFMLPFPRCIRIPAGQGLCLVTPPAVILQPADVSFFWDE